MNRHSVTWTARLGTAAKACAAVFLVSGMVGLGASVAGATTKAHTKHTKKVVVLNGHICTKVATSRHPVAVGRAGAVVCGVSGNDTLKAVGRGIVTLVAGPGHDTLRASTNRLAHDVLIGGTGLDTFQTGSGDDVVDTAPGDTINCTPSASITIAGDSQGDSESGDCQGGNVQDASQEWQGVVTTTDGSTTMTIQWSDVNDGAQAWLDANGDPATATFDITSAQINMGDGGSLAAGDQVEVAANPSDPANLAGATLTAVSVDGQGPDSQNSDGEGGDGQGDGGGGGNSPCATGTVSGAVAGDLMVVGGSCTLDGATVQGDVIAGPGATLVVQNGSTVDGDLAAVGAASVSINGSTVQGDVKIVGSTGAVSVTSDTISGDLDVFGNLGGVSIGGDTIGGDLNCGVNSPAPVGGGGNTISGSANGQCAGF